MSTAADAADVMALLTALRLLRQPAPICALRRAPLPSGVTFLLQVVADDAAAITRAVRITGRSPDNLSEAAAFFVEQILFYEQADCYRVLGASSSASTADLRRHVALLMRWLHPDTKAHLREGHIDRSVFTTKVTAAWQVLKTPERRASYEASRNDRLLIPSAVDGRLPSPARSRQRPRLRLRRLAKDDFLTRLLFFFWGR